MKLKKATADTILLQITYDKLHISLKNRNAEKEIDAANSAGSFDPVEQILGMIRGASLYVTVNTKGDILKVEGSKEITGRIMEALNTQDVYTKQAVQEQLSRLIGDDFVKNNLQQGFALFPDTTLSVGGNWDGRYVSSSGYRWRPLQLIHWFL